MGLLQHILDKQLHLSWVEDAKGRRDIKPGWYLAVEVTPQSPPQEDPAELKNEAEHWLIELAGIFETIPAQSRFLSGALGLFALTEEYPWRETFTELALFSQRPLLEAHVEAARAHNYRLMRRISARRSIGSPIKYHFFHPATIQDALGAKRQPRRNLELTRFDPAAGIICQEFIPHNHIRLRLHKDVPGGMVCTGDRKPVRYAPEHFKGLACDILGKRMFVIDPRYTLWREQQRIQHRTVKHPENHLDLIRRCEAFLAQHHEQFV